MVSYILYYYIGLILLHKFEGGGGRPATWRLGKCQSLKVVCAHIDDLDVDEEHWEKEKREREKNDAGLDDTLSSSNAFWRRIRSRE